VDDAALVSGLESFRELAPDCDHFVERDRARIETIRERLPLDEFEDQRVHAVRFFEAVDRADVLVIQCGERLCLAAELSQAIGSECRPQREDFERDNATEACVPRAIHLMSSGQLSAAWARRLGSLLRRRRRSTDERQSHRTA
jgi:hypothetical protein